jgi:hypothetical protein
MTESAESGQQQLVCLKGGTHDGERWHAPRPPGLLSMQARDDETRNERYVYLDEETQEGLPVMIWAGELGEPGN